MFEKLDGAFGTAEYYYCVHPLDVRGKRISNVAFLPKDDKIKSCFWNVLSKTPPEAIETRYLVLTLLEMEGK